MVRNRTVLGAVARLKKDHLALEKKIVVPSLARYEILNVPEYSDGFGTQELVRASRDLENFQFLELPLDERCGETAVRIAIEHGITIYDSSYLAVGQLQIYLSILRRAGVGNGTGTRLCASHKEILRGHPELSKFLR